MKTVGIITDNYKVEKFKKELIKNGFTNFLVLPFFDGTTNIQVKVYEVDLNKFQKVVQMIEFSFKHSN